MENRIIRSNHITDGAPYHFECTGFTLRSIGKRFVKSFLNVKRMTFKQGINPFYILNIDLTVPFLEMSDNEWNIYNDSSLISGFS